MHINVAWLAPDQIMELCEILEPADGRFLYDSCTDFFQAVSEYEDGLDPETLQWIIEAIEEILSHLKMISLSYQSHSKALQVLVFQLIGRFEIFNLRLFLDVTCRIFAIYKSILRSN